MRICEHYSHLLSVLRSFHLSLAARSNLTRIVFVEHTSRVVYSAAMRKINKEELNIYLTQELHELMKQLRETGVNMSSLARLAIRKFGNESLIDLPELDSPKSKRVNLYLDPEDMRSLESIATREGVKRSEVLRRILAKYLLINRDALKSLF